MMIILAWKRTKAESMQRIEMIFSVSGEQAKMWNATRGKTRKRSDFKQKSKSLPAMLSSIMLRVIKDIT